jgi:2-keto-3-deoxy-L-rhamnonate aldolase RhmA
MKGNHVKQALGTGGTAIGTMVFEFTVPGLGQILDAAGADFVMLDMEHTGLSTERLAMLMATIHGTEVVPFVRVPTATWGTFSRVLDLGAMGVMLPNVESASQVQAAVLATKYPPVGHRGSAFGVAHDGYRKGNPQQTMRLANENTMVIAQIESEEGVARSREIAAVDGVDVLWIGQNDLTASLGIAGQFSHPRYLGAVETVLRSCEEHGVAAGFCATSVEEAQGLVTLGVRCLAYQNDIAIYRNGLSAGIETLREWTRSLSVGPPPHGPGADLVNHRS